MSLQAVPRPVSPQPKLYTPQVQIAVARSWGDAFSCLKTWLGIPERRKRMPSDIGWVEWVAFTVFVVQIWTRKYWGRYVVHNARAVWKLIVDSWFRVFVIVACFMGMCMVFMILRAFQIEIL